MSLRAETLSCVLGGRTVLAGVDLAVEPGEVLGVVGPNGSGKSTLLRALAGIRRPAAGRVLLDGTPLTAMRARQRARRIAFVGQEEDLPADLCVGEVVALGLVPHRPPWSGGDAAERAAVTAALAAVQLDGLADRPVDRLSGGERRRVLLARGLAQDAGVLLLDEPTNHLDVRHALGLLELVRSHWPDRRGEPARPRPRGPLVATASSCCTTAGPSRPCPTSTPTPSHGSSGSPPPASRTR
ncbi:ABC transporter ATP-binding protein [Pseudonocardia sp. ICBG601]|uniref:ABC transporter ATP-binding protein n=1 Tax=Pseudonocardia sp. ICBG601 TaxID=2846759 RepID=UPI001CF61F5A|nr:ABC transporter ATP-binding protein [Pseudonocardia sp. ICBG601]